MFLGQRSYFESIFGDLDQLEGSDKDPKTLILDLQKTGRPIPRIYMACGVTICC